MLIGKSAWKNPQNAVTTIISHGIQMVAKIWHLVLCVALLLFPKIKNGEKRRVYKYNTSTPNNGDRNTDRYPLFFVVLISLLHILCTYLIYIIPLNTNWLLQIVWGKRGKREIKRYASYLVKTNTLNSHYFYSGHFALFLTFFLSEVPFLIKSTSRIMLCMNRKPLVFCIYSVPCQLFIR